jgi:hypothetical protein
VSGYPGKLDPKLKAHLNKMLARFHVEIRRREKTPLGRAAALYACARLAHQRASSDPERHFWKWYLANLEGHLEKLKAEALKRKWGVA